MKPRRTSRHWKIEKEDFLERFHRQFFDPNFDRYRQTLYELGEVAWENYLQGRKAPRTTRAGDDYADPEYELSDDWLRSKCAVDRAQSEYHKGETRILLIRGSDRSQHTCPGEVSKTNRLSLIAEETLKDQGLEVDVLDLSELTSQYGKVIYPCKGCVSTAMPLCHWPCSCYPNHSLGQDQDWMAEIYPLWVRAHGIMILTPVYWHQAPSALKLMIDRLVCADGGNPDPTRTHGKNAEKAKDLELAGWDYPRHLKGRVFSVVVHGDAVGVNELKTALTEWMEEMELISAGSFAQLGRYLGYLTPYATSHEALDKDESLQQEVRNAAETLAQATLAQRAGKLAVLEADVNDPRPK